MQKRFVSAVFVVAVALILSAASATAQNIDAKEYRLDNGMQVLMVERHESPTIMASIFAKVGSANEITGITGISHLFEHMMFKGTETIGTKDIVRDREIMAQLDSLRDLMRAEESIMREQMRRGEIEDMYDPAAKTPRYREIEMVFDSLILQQRELIIKDQLDEIYTKNGGFFLNAFTNEDMTGYFRSSAQKIKSNSTCGWSRIASADPYSENSTPSAMLSARSDASVSNQHPTGLIEEDFQSMFWKSSSYHWDVIGWPSDLGSITRRQADDYFDTYYAPNNLVMILVGDLEPDKMIKLVRTIFRTHSTRQGRPARCYHARRKTIRRETDDCRSGNQPQGRNMVPHRRLETCRQLSARSTSRYYERQNGTAV